MTDATTAGEHTETPKSTMLCMLLDRSGSMQAIKSDVQGGFDAFVESQRALAGPCHVTLNQFDSEYECVYRLRELADVPPLDLQPRGTTALLDAVGRTVTDLQHDLDAVPVAERPEKVVVVILTDGFENASVEWTYPAVKELVQSKQPAWDFVFIGAEQDAVVEGANLGVDADAALSHRATSRGTRGMFDALSTSVLRSRASGTVLSFTSDERAQAMADDDDA